MSYPPINSPMWKDIEYRSSADTLDFLIADSDGNVLKDGYAKRMPDQTGITINVNNIVEEYVGCDFEGDIRMADDDVIPNPNGYRVFQVRERQDGGSTVWLENYGFLYDWSYEDRWTGQTEYAMTEPINGHIDPRMKTMFTIYNFSDITINWNITYDTFVNVFPSKLIYEHIGGSDRLRVVSNVNWTITSYPEWLSIDVTSGTGSYSSQTTVEILVIAPPSVNSQNRTGDIVFTYEGGTTVVNVFQGHYITLEVTPTLLSFEYSGGTSAVTVTSNGDWKILNKPSWVTTSVTAGTGNAVVTVSATTNQSLDIRSGSILFATENESAAVEVSQGNLHFNVSPTSLYFKYSGGTQQVTVTSDCEWTITDKPNWVTTSVSAGTSGVTVFDVSCPENEDDERSGFIVFTFEGGTYSLPIRQQETIWTIIGVLDITDISQPTRLVYNNRWRYTYEPRYWYNSGNWADKTDRGPLIVEAVEIDGTYIALPESRYGIEYGPTGGTYVDYWDYGVRYGNWAYQFTETGHHTIKYFTFDSANDGYDGKPWFTGLNRADAGVPLIEIPKIRGAVYGIRLDNLPLEGNFTVPSQFVGYNENELHIDRNISFKNCKSLTSVTFTNTYNFYAVPSGGTFYGCTSLTQVSYVSFVNLANGDNLYNNDWIFMNCTSFQGLATLPSDMDYIPGWFYCNCSAVTSVTIPQGVTSLQESCFDGTGIRQLTIPNSVHGLGARCLANCESLTSVTIGNSVDILMAEVFSGDVNLHTIYCHPQQAPELYTTYGHPFDGMAAYGTFHYPANGAYYDYLIGELPSGWTAVADL